MDFEFKPKLSVILVVIHGASVGLAYVVSSRKRYSHHPVVRHVHWRNGGAKLLQREGVNQSTGFKEKQYFIVLNSRKFF